MAAPRVPFNVTGLNIEVPADGQREVTFSVATGVLDDTWTVEIAGTTVAEGDGTDSFVAVFPASADGQRWQLSHEGIERVAGVVIPRPLRNALDLTTLELTVDDGGTVIDIEVDAVGPVGPPGVVAATGIATYDDLTQTIDVPMPTAADVGAATAAQGATADTAVQPGDLASVATTGDYDDLTGKPTLGTAAAEDVTDFATAAQGVLAGTAVQPGDLSAVATSGAYADLSGAPSIPNDPGDIGAATAAQGALADTSLQPADIGSSVQGHDSDLTAIAALDTTSWGRALLTLADAAAARAVLGVGHFAPDLPGVLGLGRRVGANVTVTLGRCMWIPMPLLAVPAKATTIWVKTATGVASCAMTGAICAAKSASLDAPGTILGSTSVGAMSLASSSAVVGGTLTSPVTLAAGVRYFVQIIALNGASNPTVQGADGLTEGNNWENGSAGPVTPTAQVDTAGIFVWSGRSALENNPARASYVTSNTKPFIYVSLEAP